MLISASREDLLDDIINKHYLVLEKVKTNNLSNFVFNNGKGLSHITHLIVDLTCLNDTNEEIVSSINSLRKIYLEIRIIIIADTDKFKLENKDLLRRIYEKGVLDILTDTKEENLEKSIITGMTDEDVKDFFVERPNLSDLEDRKKLDESLKEEVLEEILTEILPNRDFRKYKPYVTVAVCGVEGHIGVTHNSILITKFLNNIGFKACYLEANDQQKIFDLKMLYPQHCTFNTNKNFVQCFNLHLYSGFNIAKVLTESYDFFIFDLGTINELKLTSFLTKDIKILISGSKAWEVNKLKDLIPTLGTKNQISFMFNFYVNGTENKIHNMIGDLKNKSYFLEYVENPFTSGINIKTYKDIFKEYIVQNQEPPKKSKFKLFGGGIK